MHIYAKFEFATTKTVACNAVYKRAKKLTYNADNYNAHNTYNNYNATTTWKCDHLSSAELNL